VFSLLLHVVPEQEDYLIAELADCGVTGITEEAGALRAFFEDRTDAPRLLVRFAQYQPELGAVEPFDWAQATRESWPPLEIGERFYLVAPWWESATPGGRLRLVIEPGMACGTGRHPATQLCLEAMEKHLLRGAAVLDVGTGSGILAQAALLLGAGLTIACDVDPDAIAIARARTEPQFFVGSMDAVRSKSEDLIIANIDAETLESLAPEIDRVRKPESKLILSGFPPWDIPGGFSAIETLRREEWVCLVC
jgi:ribosomal protein L11 methyltransferase